MKILPTKRRCPTSTCRNRMELRPCSTMKYREGSCWKCSCGQTTSVRTDSVLQNSNISYRNFILILNLFAENFPTSRAAESIGVAETTVRRFYTTIREQIAADVQTSSRIGGPGTVVEVDEAARLNRGGRRTTDSLAMNLTFYMWMRQHGLTRIRDSSRALFSKHLPRLLNYRRFYDW